MVSDTVISNRGGKRENKIMEKYNKRWLNGVF
jgi:hypothetical protein